LVLPLPQLSQPPPHGGNCLNVTYMAPITLLPHRPAAARLSRPWLSGAQPPPAQPPPAQPQSQPQLSQPPPHGGVCLNVTYMAPIHCCIAGQPQPGCQSQPPACAAAAVAVAGRCMPCSFSRNPAEACALTATDWLGGRAAGRLAASILPLFMKLFA